LWDLLGIFGDKACAGEVLWSGSTFGHFGFGAGELSSCPKAFLGAGLLGMAVGQTILWPTQDGRERPLTVLRVSRQRYVQEPA
jgi:hypothetical protein